MIGERSSGLNIAVVGHTNVGKTSLLRTLLRDAAFGEVSHRPSTTRHVEGAALRVDGEVLLVLHDTPGLEDGIGLRDYLDRLAQAPQPTDNARRDRMDGPDCVQAFLASAEARGRYEQEAKVLRQMLRADAGIYVIDVREPVLPKYRDELAVLAMEGKPLLPVFNFVRADASHEQDWRDVLARLGLHAAVRFDTVAPPVDGEQRLYDSLAVLLERARPVIERIQADLSEQAQERRRTAARLMADLLLDVAAARRLSSDDEPAVKAAIESLHEAVRQREQQCTRALLSLYAFRPGDAVTQGFPGFDGDWDHDLFKAETLKRFGVHVGSGMAAGAAIGAGLDVMLAGLSLGTGTLVGAIAGGTFETMRNYGQRIMGRLQGERELRVDDVVLRLLALRQMGLVRALEARGHAAQDAIVLDVETKDASELDGLDWRKSGLPQPLQKARSHPEWSSINADDGYALDTASVRDTARARSQTAMQYPQRQVQVMALAPQLMPKLMSRRSSAE